MPSDPSTMSRPPSGWKEALLQRQRVARLATVDPQGHPHVLPIVYAYDDQKLYTPIDAKPKRVPTRRLRRVRNIESNPRVSVVVDEYDEDWSRLAWVQLRGLASLVETGPDHAVGVRLLEAKYPQYAMARLADRPVIVLSVTRVTGWHAA